MQDISYLYRLLLFCLVSSLPFHQLSGQVPSFAMPAAVCTNTPVNIVNTSTGGTSYFWSFCSADLTQTPEAVNLGNIFGTAAQPVFIEIVSENNNYYGLLTSHYPGLLMRLDFGNSLLNTPTVTNLGNLGALDPDYGTEGLQVVRNNGRWYAFIVGGSPSSSSEPQLVKVDFGPSITNPTPVATDYGTIGGLLQPIKLYMFQDNGNWYAYTVNSENNTITRFDFGTDFTNPPAAVNLGNPGGQMNYPTGIYSINNAGNWHVFITNGNPNISNSIIRLDYGNSLLNTPTVVNLGNPGNVFQSLRDMTVIQTCDQTIGFVTDGQLNTLVRLDFHNDITSVPTVVSLGNIGDLSLPHSLSKLFRIGNDLYTFIPNAYNNTLTRVRFPGCTNSNIPNSSLSTPPVISYSQPGTYRVQLNMDDGLPSQSSYCQTINVLGTPDFSLGNDTSLCRGDSLTLRYVGDPVTLLWQDGSVADTFAIGSGGQYTLITKNVAGCSASHSITVSYTDTPTVNTLPVASFCEGNSVMLTTSVQQADSVRWSPATGLSDPVAQSPFANPLVNTRYIVTAFHEYCQSKDTVDVTRLLKPDLTITGQGLVCTGGSTRLQAQGASLYNWTPVVSLSDPTLADPMASPDTTMYFYVTGTADNTCTNIDSFQVQVRKPDKFDVAAQPSRICAGDTSMLLVKGGDLSWGDSYTWLFDVGTQDPHAGNLTVAPAGTDLYSVLAYDKICDVYTTLSVSVDVGQRPVVSLEKSNDIGCIYGETTLSATGGVLYTWSPVETLSDPYAASPVARTGTSTLYHVTVTGDNGCTTADSILVTVSKGSGSIGFPIANAFTPNGDGANDRFGVKYWGYISDFRMSVFDRWGKLVFETHNPEQSWDGNNGGIPQPSGTYVYIVTANTLCGQTFKKGTVMVIR